MIRILAALIFLAPMNGQASARSFELSRAVFDNQDFELIPHHGSGRFGSYLSMEINFEPMADLFRQLLLDQRRSLTNRGEAHITVITPIEYFDVLKEKDVTIEEIDAIAERRYIQSSLFEVVCLGRGNAEIDQRTESTFYVVVKSEPLLEIRREVQRLYIAKGGRASDFVPENYYPHITLGFTKRDLHESDGIIKDESSCWADIDVE